MIDVFRSIDRWIKEMYSTLRPRNSPLLSCNDRPQIKLNTQNAALLIFVINDLDAHTLTSVHCLQWHLWSVRNEKFPLWNSFYSVFSFCSFFFYRHSILWVWNLRIEIKSALNATHSVYCIQYYTKKGLNNNNAMQQYEKRVQPEIIWMIY